MSWWIEYLDIGISEYCRFEGYCWGCQIRFEARMSEGGMPKPMENYRFWRGRWTWPPDWPPIGIIPGDAKMLVSNTVTIPISTHFNFQTYPVVFPNIVWLQTVQYPKSPIQILQTSQNWSNAAIELSKYSNILLLAIFQYANVQLCRYLWHPNNPICKHSNDVHDNILQ